MRQQFPFKTQCIYYATKTSPLVYHSAVEVTIPSNCFLTCMTHTHTCILHKCDRWGGMG